MTKKRTLSIYCLTLLTVFAFTMVWEFALEPIIASEIENESTRENWEHVLTVLSISALALIYPFLLLQRKIDQERRTEGLYRKSEERLGGAIESLREGFALYDADDRLISFNKKYQQLRPQAKEIMERRGTFEDVIRSSVAEGKIIEAIGREEEFIQERLEQHRNPKDSVIRRFSDDTWYRIEEVRTPEGGVALSFIDITELKKAEEDRQQALIEAGNALVEVQMATQAKTEFLAAMSHELRTPLNAILGFADILNNQYFGPIGEKKYLEYASDIKLSGEHLLALVNDILDISAIEAGKHSLDKEKLSSVKIVAECARIVGEKAYDNGIQLVTEVAYDLPFFLADRRATKQILLNVLSNAVKFTSGGGKITFSAKTSNGSTIFQVVDTGIGIPPDDLPKITDPFRKRLHNPYLSEEGWGLGLAITKSLIDLHEGEMDIESTVGKGTTVTVIFPNGAP